MESLLSASEAAPRLAPIDRPRSLLAWLMQRLLARMLGRVMMPARVVYPRMPRVIVPMLAFYWVLGRGLHLDPLLSELVMLRVSHVHGCSFCTDLHRFTSLRNGRARALLDASLAHAPGEPLTPAQVAALAYVSEVRPDGSPSEATFAALRAHFDERAIVELTVVAAFTGYLNALAKALGIGSDGFCAVR